MELKYKLGPNRPPIMEAPLRKWFVKHFCIAAFLGCSLAECYRRFHTIPHIKRRTEYYDSLGVHWKPIV